MKKSTLYFWHLITLSATIFYVFKTNFHIFDIIYNIWFYFGLLTFLLAFEAYFSTIYINHFFTWKFFNFFIVNAKEKLEVSPFIARFAITLLELKKKLIESYQKNEHMNLYVDIIYYLTTISVLLYAELYFFASVWFLKSIFDFKMRYDNRPIKPIIV